MSKQQDYEELPEEVIEKLFRVLWEHVNGYDPAEDTSNSNNPEK